MISKDAPLSDALDRLYGAPLDRFVTTRRELAAELRAQGDVESAKALGAAVKPTRILWAMNQVARRSSDVVRAMLGSRDAAVAAQKSGNADELRVATRAFRTRMNDVLREVRNLLGEDGAQSSPAQLRRLGETLQAISAGDPGARERLIQGRLVQDVDNEDPFSELAVPPGRKRQRSAASPIHRPPSPRSANRDDGRALAEQRELARRLALVDAAAKRLAELEEASREARGSARTAETAAMRAQDEAQRARRMADDVEARVQKARAELKALRG